MKLTYLCILLFFPLLVIAQGNIEIKGKINNILNGELNNIEVHLEELHISTHTNLNGEFSFLSIPYHDFYTFHIVYQGNKLPSKVITLNKTNLHNITLEVTDENILLEDILIQTRTKSEILKNNAIKADIIDIENNTLKANSIEELVNRAPGVKIRNVGGLGSTSNIIVGGFTGNAVKFLYDNVPIDYLGSSYGLTKIPTNMVGRIEVYKGVLPTKIGVDALGSAINIIPSKNSNTGGSVSYEFGSYNTNIATLNATIKLNKNWHLGTNSFYNYSKNNYKVNKLPYLDEATGKTLYIREKLFHNAFEQGSVEFYIQGQDFSWADLIEFKFNSFELTKDIQNDPYSRARAFGKVYRKEKGTFIPSLKYKKSFLDNHLSISQFLVFSKIDYELFDKARNEFYDWKGQVHQTSSASEMGNLILKNGYLKNTLKQITSRTNLNYLINDYYQLESNIVYNHYKRQSNLDEINNNGTKYNKLIATFALNSTYLDGKLEANTQIKYLLGHLSGNYQASDDPTVTSIASKEISKSGFSFSQALKYSINDSNYLRASYENTYRLPDQDELFGDNNFIIANYDLNPEKSNNFNLGYTYHIDKLTLELNSYYRDTKELIRLKDLNQYQAKFFNLDHVRGFGVEFEAAYRPLSNLLIIGNLTWNDFRLESSKDNLINNQHFKKARIANMPFYYGNLSASYNFKDLLAIKNNFTFYWNYSYVHQYYLDFIEKQFEPDGFLGLWGNSKINTSRIIPVQHLNTTGITYSKGFNNQSLSVSAELKNIFNEEIFNEFKMQSPGRNFRVKVTYNF